MNNLYERIEKLCKGKKISITKMCTESGVTRGILTDLKSGRTKTLSAQTLALIANYFGVSVDYLLDNEKIPTEGEDIKEYLELLRERPETRMLLDYSKGISKKEIEAVAEMMRRLRADD